MINTNNSYLSDKSIKSSVSFDSIKSQSICSANEFNSDSTLCASNIIDSEVIEVSANEKCIDDRPKQWETVQTLCHNRASINSKQKVTESEQIHKKANYTSNPLTYLKSALFSQKSLHFKLKSQTSSSIGKRTIRQSISLIIPDTNNSRNSGNKSKEQNNCLCDLQINNNKSLVLKQKPNLLVKSRSDESLNSNPNSFCSSCVSNDCSVCNDISNNCFICQQLSKCYTNSLKLKSNQLFAKQLIQSTINQISLSRCECFSCVTNSSSNISQNYSIGFPTYASNSGIS